MSDPEPPCDHDWRWKEDWGGDSEVIGGTFDASRWECRLCGTEDCTRPAPVEDTDP